MLIRANFAARLESPLSGIIQSPIYNIIRCKAEPEERHTRQEKKEKKKMATLKYCIVKKDMRRDKTWRVQIRLTHDRKTRMIPTSMYVSRSDLNSSYQIKNPAIIAQCEDLIREYKDKIETLDLALVDMDVERIRKEITRKDIVTDVEFFAFARKWIEKDCRPKTRKKYQTSVNRFEGYVKMKHGRDSGHPSLP